MTTFVLEKSIPFSRMVSVIFGKSGLTREQIRERLGPAIKQAWAEYKASGKKSQGKPMAQIMVAAWKIVKAGAGASTGRGAKEPRESAAPGRNTPADMPDESNAPSQNISEPSKTAKGAKSKASIKSKKNKIQKGVEGETGKNTDDSVSKAPAQKSNEIKTQKRRTRQALKLSQDQIDRGMSKDALKPDVRTLAKSMKKIMKGLTDNSLLHVITFNELYKNLLPEFPDLSISHFRDTLNTLCNNEVIDLHPMNDKNEEIDKELTIPTSIGNLNYLLWRDDIKAETKFNEKEPVLEKVSNEHERRIRTQENLTKDEFELGMSENSVKPDKKKLKDSIKKASHDYFHDHSAHGGIVSFPALYKNMLHEYPDLSIDHFKSVVKELSEEGTAQLHSATDEQKNDGFYDVLGLPGPNLSKNRDYLISFN